MLLILLLVRWKKSQPDSAFTVMASTMRHTWYLAPQTVVISLCDPDLGVEEKVEVARALHSTPGHCRCLGGIWRSR